MPSQADLLGHFFSKGVLAKLGATGKDSLTFGAADAGALPVRCDAGKAEAVTAGDGDGLTENILADKTTKLHLRQRNSGRHDLRNKERNIFKSECGKPLFSYRKYEANNLGKQLSLFKS